MPRRPDLDNSALLQGLQRQGGLDADLLLVNCGLHDIKTNPQTGQRQVAIDQYAENLHAIVTLVATMGPTLVWIRTTPCDERVHNQLHMTFHRFAADGDAYNAVADAIMRAADVPMIDLHTFTRNLGPDLYCDHVHFHEAVRAQ